MLEHVFNVPFLSRLQFALTIGFHYIFPPLSIGLGVVLVLIEFMYLKTRDVRYLNAAKFWTGIFALIFGVGVATGIVMEFEFGTNWATYSRFVGDVFGSALASEGIFAFFLESGFLALLVFGWDKIGPRLHFFSTLMVALGAHFSAVWIVVANSWMQTPAGYHIVTTPGMGTRAEITDFWAMVFNPSSMVRLSHTIGGAWVAAATVVLSVAAWYLIKKRHTEFAKLSLKVGLIVALAASGLQMLTGHESALVVAEHQPAKLAAMEGHYAKSAPGALSLFGWVDEKNERVIGVSVPGMLSWLVHMDPKAPLPGLNNWAPKDRPPVQLTFQSYHAMVGLGMLMMGLFGWAAFAWWRGTLFGHRFILPLLVVSPLMAQLANQLGWMTAEVGRQPWIVYNLLRTVQAVSPRLTTGEVLASLIMFTLLYFLLFALFVFVLNHKIQKGPNDGGPVLSDIVGGSGGPRPLKPVKA